MKWSEIVLSEAYLLNRIAFSHLMQTVYEFLPDIHNVWNSLLRMIRCSLKVSTKTFSTAQYLEHCVSLLPLTS